MSNNEQRMLASSYKAATRFVKNEDEYSDNWGKYVNTGRHEPDRNVQLGTRAGLIDTGLVYLVRTGSRSTCPTSII